MVAPRALDELGARDVLGEVSPRLHRDHAVVGPMEHECRHADRRQHVPDVDLHRDPEPGKCRGRRAREPARLGVPLPEPLVVGKARGKRPDAEVGRAPASLVGREDLLLALLVEPPGEVGRRRPARVRRTEDERRRSLRERGGEQRAHRAALRAPEERRALGRGSVEHGADVVHHLLEGAERQDPVREARASPVEQDQARERGKAVEHVRVGRPPPVLLEVREVARGPEEVDRAVADHLVRDPEVSATGVSRLGVHREEYPSNGGPLHPHSVDCARAACRSERQGRGAAACAAVRRAREEGAGGARTGDRRALRPGRDRPLPRGKPRQRVLRHRRGHGGCDAEREAARDALQRRLLRRDRPARDDEADGDCHGDHRSPVLRVTSRAFRAVLDDNRSVERKVTQALAERLLSYTDDPTL